MTRSAFSLQHKALRTEICALIDHGTQLEVVKAPPGSGKTVLMAEVIHHAFRKNKRIAVATQTNTQADHLCHLLATEHPDVTVVRFLSNSARDPRLPSTVILERAWAQLPPKKCVVVGTATKWGTARAQSTFDLLFIEEAWQLAWSDFMLLHQVADRFLLIGDPGQIPPVVTIDTSRWETAQVPPHMPAPEVILNTRGAGLKKHQLPATWRLPSDAVDMIRPFYDFDFGAANRPSDRFLKSNKKASSRQMGAVLERLEAGAVTAYMLPTPDEGPPLEKDREIAAATVNLAAQLLSMRPTCHMDGEDKPLVPTDIGIIASHRSMVSEIALGLPSQIRDGVTVDTPERWQGLQRKVMLFVHPLSGTTTPSAFDLETGRLCVMASRHQVACVLVGRDHIGDTLDETYPTAEQAPGRPDSVGRGHFRHRTFWETLKKRDRIIFAG